MLHGTLVLGECSLMKQTIKICPVLKEETKANTSRRLVRQLSVMTFLTTPYLEGLLEHLIGQLLWLDGDGIAVQRVLILVTVQSCFCVWRNCIYGTVYCICTSVG